MADRKIDAMHKRFGTSNHLCKECNHLLKHTHQRTYYKCKAYGCSRSTATDWKVSNVACGLFGRELPPLFVPVVDQIKHESRKQPERPLDGQMMMEV